jgi:hypothetical protein
MPDVLVLEKRPSFTGGGTDGCEYAWFIWRKGRLGSTGKVRVLEIGP